MRRFFLYVKIWGPPVKCGASKLPIFEWFVDDVATHWSANIFAKKRIVDKQKTDESTAKSFPHFLIICLIGTFSDRGYDEEMWVATDNLKPPNRIPAGIDKGGHLPLPARNVVKCCCALVVTSNRSADEVFMQLTTDNLWVIWLDLTRLDNWWCYA